VNSRLLKISESSCSEHIYDENKAKWPPTAGKAMSEIHFCKTEKEAQRAKGKKHLQEAHFGNVLLQLPVDRV
jgi:hypothetical protein